MGIGQEYREYNAWLQPHSYRFKEPFRLNTSPEVPMVARDECKAGMERLFGSGIWQEDAKKSVTLHINSQLPAEGYRLTNGSNGIAVEGGSQNGILYGVFGLLRALGIGQFDEGTVAESAPAVERRVINQWDRADGTVERGYAGNSIFFKDDRLDFNPERIRDYARLLASIGINVIAINNVNVTESSARLLTAEALPKVAELADIFRPYGIRLALSVHFESPVLLGGLQTSDPLDKRVAAWWNAKTQEIYQAIPDFSGYLMKADSEFRGGPASLGRTQADGANMLARAVAPFGGVVYWRCFIYNCMQDWRDTDTDRPKAAYDLFKPQDGLFEKNVILQVKNGPSDFQVREPNSPLLGAMKHTREALELQITQEYTGHQIDLYNLAVQWEEVFSFPVNRNQVLRDLIGNEIDTVAAVSNVGDDENWTGHTLAQANLYSFGRLAWNPRLTAREITDEWIKLTFGTEPEVVEKLTDIMMSSRGAYEKYNAPLGIGWMVNINLHYGPSPDGYEFMKWGTYHRANRVAIGVDRTSRGTGFTKQYDPYLTEIFDSRETCPEELLLYFHRLPYTYVLKSGKTLLQHIYDTHFEGVQEVERFIALWETLKAKLPGTTFVSVKQRLLKQLENAEEWRDVINTFFYRLTGTTDEKGRKIYE
ncbi:glycoside hydrolase family 20 zincin-like fold domain-containing protein [Acetanaerobacterium elongatum]|uniref:Alpha-glucuronidase n=1 Tax=Acetanaerobacterium elongatum TaxID=258515 RepID=A0A1H0C7I9_9FIRM|nr:glycoside hydrolase family 20 zincin-like fold domain-containing protein [Acetanaerobacterium elongatum]SDN53781.1 alpha-glucuronidase [Acetanaerobacterium elongatum]